MQLQSFDDQLFTWKHWSSEGPMSMQFVEVELTVPVGSFPAGTKFPNAFIFGSNSVLVLIDDQGGEHPFHLKLSVGEPVDMDALHAQEEQHADACDCGHQH